MSESVPMSDWSKLNPVELVELSQFPTADDHMDGWDMYLPRDWPHWDVLERGGRRTLANATEVSKG